MYDIFDYGSEYSDLLDSLSGIMDTLNGVFKFVLFIFFIIGVLECLFGYKWIRFVMAVSGFTTGFTMGVILDVVIAVKSQSFNLSLLLFIALALGITGACIAYGFYKLGLFLIGFSGVYAFFAVICLAASLVSGGDNFMSAFILPIIPAALAGILVYKFAKPIIIIYTSVVGAYMAAISLSGIIDGGQAFIFIVMCAVGIFFQCKTNNGLTEKKKPYPQPNPVPQYVPQPNPVPPYVPQQPVQPQMSDDLLPEIKD